MGVDVRTIKIRGYFVDIVFICIVVIFAIVFTLYTVYRCIRKEFNLAIDILEVLTGMYLSGLLSEDEYIQEKEKVINNFSFTQRKMFVKLKGKSDSES